jgi:predicted transcriptional regulator
VNELLPIDIATLAFGLSEARITVLREVLQHRRRSTSQVMEATGLSRNGALNHLRALAIAGLVIGARTTHPRGAGPITYWQADEDSVVDALDAIEVVILERRD